MLLATRLTWVMKKDLLTVTGSPIALPESTDHEEAGPSQALPGRVVSANEARMSNFYYRFVGYKRL